MNPTIQSLWSAELRSGRYRQGLNRLRRHDDTYCCLGVLCDLAAQAGVGRWGKSSSDGHVFDCDKDVKSECFLPKPVMMWAGLPDIEGFRHDGYGLPCYNDGVGGGSGPPRFTFSQIADLIERYAP